MNKIYTNCEMKHKILLKQINGTGFVLLFAVLTSLALFSCKKLDFTKTEINPPPGDTWLYYDNGTNYTSINASGGVNFDIAIRFTKEQIDSYQGFLISKVTFFPVEGYPAAYSVEIWEGGDSPTLVHIAGCVFSYFRRLEHGIYRPVTLCG